ncbi:uncharacterized protein LOC131225226 [Magnolia sinica]|uniref:uncharacterized protein LOC131225226 n=1 Tax=Magnolia sinica TaxID=86752 RepID=UPI002657C8DB|nr:uncharacterized protein LOC131225226 [Magnolia sinica]
MTTGPSLALTAWDKTGPELVWEANQNTIDPESVPVGLQYILDPGTEHTDIPSTAAVAVSTEDMPLRRVTRANPTPPHEAPALPPVAPTPPPKILAPQTEDVVPPPETGVNPIVPVPGTVVASAVAYTVVAADGVTVVLEATAEVAAVLEAVVVLSVAVDEAAVVFSAAVDEAAVVFSAAVDEAAVILSTATDEGKGTQTSG